MVLQSNFLSEVMDILESQNYSVDLGQSSSVDYNDNAIDTTLVSKNVTTSKLGNVLTFTFELQTGEGNGNTFNAFLLKMNDIAMNKCLHIDIIKNDTTIIQYVSKIEVWVD